MPRIIDIPDQAGEPARLDDWAQEQLSRAKEQVDGRLAVRLILLAADAQRAAATIRAVRAARKQP